MRATRFSKILAVLSVLLLVSSCAQTRPDSTYLASNTSGFGGTGKYLDPTSGFGGTGKSSSGFGGTGIIGTITEFGSIWVNGIEIAYGKNTQVTSNLRTHDGLKLGQQVVLQTEPNKNKTFTRKIEVFYPVAGKITKVNGGSIEISGHYKVTINKDTFMDKGLSLSKGNYIAVNGYQVAENNWVGTRLNLNPGHKSLYQVVPKALQLNQVNRWIIESGHGQLKQYAAQLKVTVNSAKESLNNRVVLEVMNQNGNMKLESMESYHEHLRMQNLKEMRSKERGVPIDDSSKMRDGQDFKRIEKPDVNEQYREMRKEADDLNTLKTNRALSQDQKEQMFQQQHEQIELQHEQQHIMRMQQEQQQEFKQIQEQQKQIYQQMEDLKQIQRSEGD
ncbi:DUF5666 domain-containing protein [Hydrogenovibrio kuenenii]|uniref:DUF5666 domain-containing protein n=1 Tax=Hydrogenovibrio kuenenii TaxID=63658 RepID=UPI0004630B01|nr:DUF5666 domain-containing protein [Hydrogenovibrio kuenenii]